MKEMIWHSIQRPQDGQLIIKAEWYKGRLMYDVDTYENPFTDEDNDLTEYDNMGFRISEDSHVIAWTEFSGFDKDKFLEYQKKEIDAIRAC